MGDLFLLVFFCCLVLGFADGGASRFLPTQGCISVEKAMMTDKP